MGVKIAVLEQKIKETNPFKLPALIGYQVHESDWKLEVAPAVDDRYRTTELR